MLLSVLRLVSNAEATTDLVTKPEPSVLVVVATGLSLVFIILVLLTIVLSLEGKIFSSIDRKKKTPPPASKPSVPQQPAAVPAPVVAPVVQEGIPPEVVAAITAAVASIEGGRYTLRSVTASQKGRGQWGLAGVISYTEPF